MSNIDMIRLEIIKMRELAAISAVGNHTDWLESRIATCGDILAFIDSLPEETKDAEQAAEIRDRFSSAERVAKVRADLERHGLDPFKDKSRGMLAVAMRQCVFLMLRREGYTQKELGDATGYDHSTVSWGEAHARDLVNLGDSLYTQVWNKINMIDEGMI